MAGPAEQIVNPPNNVIPIGEDKLLTEPLRRWFVSIRQRLNLLAAPNLVTSASYANDAAAAAGGVQLGEFYRNGSVVQCRIT